MNERIRELAKQAGHRYYPSSNEGPLRVEYLTPELEKFAELIVRECANKAAYFSINNKRIHPDIDPRHMPYSNQMVYHATCQAVSAEIREHFGVE